MWYVVQMASGYCMKCQIDYDPQVRAREGWSNYIINACALKTRILRALILSVMEAESEQQADQIVRDYSPR